jgi:hypothetical protein
MPARAAAPAPAGARNSRNARTKKARRRGFRPATFQRCLSPWRPQSRRPRIPSSASTLSKDQPGTREQAPSSKPGSRDFGPRLAELWPSPKDRAGIAYVGRLRGAFKPFLRFARSAAPAPDMRLDLRAAASPGTALAPASGGRGGWSDRDRMAPDPAARTDAAAGQRLRATV